MMKKLFEPSKQVSFSNIKRTIFISFLLANLCAFLIIIGIISVLEQRGNSIVAANLKSFIALSIVFISLLLFTLYEVLVKPLVEKVRLNSENQYRKIQQSKSILENTSDLIWAIDTNYRLIAFNSSFVEMLFEETGTPPEIGESILERNYSNLSISKRKQLYDKALNGKSFEREFQYSKDGHTRYHELSFHPLYDKNKSITGCSIFRKDITRQMEIYQELQKSEEFLKEAQEIANIGHWNWDMVNDEIQWSDQLYKVFGLDRDTFEANYEGLMGIIHPEDQEAFGNSIENCLTNQQPHDIVHRIILPNGTIRHVQQKGKAYHIDGDTPIRMAGTIQDVTQLEESRLVNMRQYNELQNFVYIISHNIRSPISTLQSLVDIIEPGNEALNKEVLPTIGITVDKLDQTIKDLNHSLSLKNIQENTFEKVNLLRVLRDIEHLLAFDISSSKAELEYNLSEASELYGFRSYFTNILFNLIMNSIKYKAEDRLPIIKVTSQLNLLGATEIIVSDNGKGMNLNTERRKRIFDMYGRLTGESEGRGMGLYLAKTQVEAMSGTIDVESKPNEGTTFRINFKSLPASR